MRVRITPEYPGLVIADTGEVQGLSRWGRPIWLKQRSDKDGYKVVSYRHVPVRVHRLVCIAYHGPRPTSDHQVAHSNGINTDNRAGNLRWATTAENQADMIRHGTDLRGERHGRAKITWADVEAIRTSSEPGSVLAARYGMTRSNIAKIRTNQTWKV